MSNRINTVVQTCVAKRTLGAILAAAAIGVIPASALAGDRDRKGFRGEDRGARYEDHRDRHDDHRNRSGGHIDISFGRDHSHSHRPIVREERVWVEPVYRTVCEKVWVEPVVERRCERVWVHDCYEWRDVVHYRHGRREVCREKILVTPGHFEERFRDVVVTPGHFEERSRQELVRAGYFETRQVAYSPPHRHDDSFARIALRLPLP